MGVVYVYVEYYIDRGVLGVTKEVSQTILEYRGPPVIAHTRSKWDSAQTLVVPTMPPNLLGVCRLIQIYYLLKVHLELEKSGEDLHMHFPITIATVPFRIPNSNQQPSIHYEVAADHVEGGCYIGPEFQLGQVYDGVLDDVGGDPIVLYRPVYLMTSPLGTNSTDGASGPALTSASKTKENLKKFDLDILESKSKEEKTRKSNFGVGQHSLKSSFGFGKSSSSSNSAVASGSGASHVKKQSSSMATSSCESKKCEDTKDKGKECQSTPAPVSDTKTKTQVGGVSVKETKNQNVSAKDNKVTKKLTPSSLYKPGTAVKIVITDD